MKLNMINKLNNFKLYIYIILIINNILYNNCKLLNVNC